MPGVVAAHTPVCVEFVDGFAKGHVGDQAHRIERTAVVVITQAVDGHDAGIVPMRRADLGFDHEPQTAEAIVRISRGPISFVPRPDDSIPGRQRLKRCPCRLPGVFQGCEAVAHGKARRPGAAGLLVAEAPSNQSVVAADRLVRPARSSASLIVNRKL